MTRKFVTGDSKNVVVTVKRERVDMPCGSCGTSVSVTVPYAGDILCPKCSQGGSYSLKVVDGDDDAS